MPPLSLGDRLLKMLGKRRAVYVPADAYEKFGPYVTLRATKEPFFRALLRPQGKSMPAGAVDFYSFCDGHYTQRH
jgi:hypothetical protein